MEHPLSLMEIGRRFHAKESSLEETLARMKDGSCSVLLNWSEDDGEFWECSWIVGGKRYSGFQTDVRMAVLEAINKCIWDLVKTTEQPSTQPIQTKPKCQCTGVLEEVGPKVSVGGGGIVVTALMKIEHCPLHAAAPEMFDLLKDLKDYAFIRKFPQDERLWKRLEILMNKIEGIS